MGKKKKTSKMALIEPVTIYQLEITLNHVDPPVWRRVHVNDCSLDELHEVVQICMGWEDCHVHAFELVDTRQRRGARRRKRTPCEDASMRLSDLVEQGRSRLLYEYDFGDSWEHTIKIEKTLAPEENARYPRCVEGERACPPEDSGGPWGYQRLVEASQNPDDEEHEEILEWCGDDFDPEHFDLDQVNGELHYLRRWLGKTRGKHTCAPSFDVGDSVRVKLGVAHPEYPDIPLGGWAGEVVQVAHLTPVSHAVRWSEETLRGAHPVYHGRCERDEAAPEETWLDDVDLAPEPGGPLSMEQPTRITTRPLSMDDQGDRVRAVFGLTTDDPLPRLDDQTRAQYFKYLTAHLTFPFDAELWDVKGTQHKVTVVAIHSESPVDGDAGAEAAPDFDEEVRPGIEIVCEIREEKGTGHVPLRSLTPPEDSPHAQLLDDYSYWFWESQGPAQIDDLDDVDRDLEDDEDDENEWFDDADDDQSTRPHEYPLGTIALYGPDDQATTKIAAGVILEEDAEPILKHWTATDVLANPKVQHEMLVFFREHEVKSLLMSDGNMGCPHEEGKDFPLGGDCPFCPFWKGKQGSARGD